MNEDLMSLPGIESALNRLAKVFEPSSQIVKKVFYRTGQVDGGKKQFEPRLWVAVYYVPYPLGVYLLRKSTELYDGDPDAASSVEILPINHEWEAQERGLKEYELLEVALMDRVAFVHSGLEREAADDIPF